MTDASVRAKPLQRSWSQVKGVGSMDSWEYKVADLTKVEKDIAELNRLGAEGWEAVGMVSTWGAGGLRFVHPIALLKRQVTKA
jgi:hypothetical protein